MIKPWLHFHVSESRKTGAFPVQTGSDLIQDKTCVISVWNRYVSIQSGPGRTRPDQTGLVHMKTLDVDPPHLDRTKRTSTTRPLTRA
ncbi:hypothetical protein INR49_003580 [Caranx melampygus]|nr:hypothetical protein INR49_003595 [Caranx melampygus]KAG7234939.1 hypothetical protein INR49_003580 [Caranx melampygus]